MDPYYSDDTTTLYKGDCREVIPALGQSFGCIVADPPYGETEHAWDRWPDGWPALAAEAAESMWCFGTMRLFLSRLAEFADWQFSHDVIWRKPMGSSMRTDRFQRVHEHALCWYRGSWDDRYHVPPTERWYGPDKGEKRQPHGRFGQFGSRTAGKPTIDAGVRVMRSVLEVGWLRGRAVHPTEKPIGILDPLIRYACPPGGTVLDPFAGSGSTAAAARLSGRKAVLIEADERYCQAIVRRLQQDVLPLEA